MLPEINHQSGNKNAPNAYFKELIKTISSNFPITQRQVSMGGNDGIRRQKAINFFRNSISLRLGNFSQWECSEDLSE